MREQKKDSSIIKLELTLKDADFNLAPKEEKATLILLDPLFPIPPSPITTYRTYIRFSFGFRIKPFNFNIQDDPILAKVLIKNLRKKSRSVNFPTTYIIFARPIYGNGPITKIQPLENQEYSIPHKDDQLEWKSAQNSSPKDLINLNVFASDTLTLPPNSEKSISMEIAIDNPLPIVPPAPETYRTLEHFYQGIKIPPFTFNLKDNPIETKICNMRKQFTFVIPHFCRTIYARPIFPRIEKPPVPKIEKIECKNAAITSTEEPPVPKIENFECENAAITFTEEPPVPKIETFECKNTAITSPSWHQLWPFPQ